MHAIKFNPTSSSAKNLIPKPRPAKELSPTWYSSLPAFHENKWQVGRRNQDDPYGSANMTLKMCTPFADSLHAGYMQEAWQDIYIEFKEKDINNPNYVVPMPEPQMISHRDYASLPVGEEFYPVEFVFHPPWTPETPKGWSTLYTAPMNRPDLPLWFPSAIVDTDRFTHSCEKANIPFYMKKNFNFQIIPKGTPLYQMIPIKRESWQSLEQEFDEVKQKKICLEPSKTFWKGYKNLFWEKKEYR
jgi:hypothetical protein